MTGTATDRRPSLSAVPATDLSALAAARLKAAQRTLENVEQSRDVTEDAACRAERSAMFACRAAGIPFVRPQAGPAARRVPTVVPWQEQLDPNAAVFAEIREIEQQIRVVTAAAVDAARRAEESAVIAQNAAVVASTSAEHSRNPKSRPKPTMDMGACQWFRAHLGRFNWGSDAGIGGGVAIAVLSVLGMVAVMVAVANGFAV